jgi:hypothetical protein
MTVLRLTSSRRPAWNQLGDVARERRSVWRAGRDGGRRASTPRPRERRPHPGEARGRRSRQQRRWSRRRGQIRPSERRRSCRTPPPREARRPVRRLPAGRVAAGSAGPRSLSLSLSLSSAPGSPPPHAKGHLPHPRTPQHQAQRHSAPRCFQTESAPRVDRASRAEMALRCRWSQALGRPARFSGLPSPPRCGLSVPHLQIFSAKP